MATQGTYYLDAPSLGSATVIYADAQLSVLAADGFYSDGTLVREQVDGVLLPANVCGSCAAPCNNSISASGGQGIYYLDLDLGSSVGAVVIRFDPYSVPDGILAAYNGLLYNGLSSPTYGYLQGSSGLPTYLGEDGANCGLPSGSPYTLDEYEYLGGSFVPLGTTESVPILSGQLQFTAGSPGACLMVIPKTQPSPSILSLQIIGPCSGTAFSISSACPVALPSFNSSTGAASSGVACAQTLGQTYYVARVNEAASTLQLHDLVFSDPNGEFKLAAGYYKTNAAGSNNWFQVDANGAIIAFGTCGASTTFTVGFGGASEDACAGISTATVVGDYPVFCDCTQFTGAIFAAAPTGTWYVSYGGAVLPVSVTNGDTLATVIGPCESCVPAYAFEGCGVSDTSSLNACADAGTNPKTLYSECSTLGTGCGLYYDNALTNPVLSLYVVADGTAWDTDGTGTITTASITQC